MGSGRVYMIFDNPDLFGVGLPDADREFTVHQRGTLHMTRVRSQSEKRRNGFAGECREHRYFRMFPSTAIPKLRFPPMTRPAASARVSFSLFNRTVGAGKSDFRPTERLKDARRQFNAVGGAREV